MDRFRRQQVAPSAAAVRRLGPLVAATLACLAWAAAAPVAAQESPLDRCQSLYEQDDLAGSRAACEEAVAGDPDSYAAQWRLARVLIDLGNKAAEKKDRQRLYEAAEQHARRAVALDADDTWGHHYLAASVGKLALFFGGKKKIELSREVRDEAERAVELDPDNDRAHHILGRWNREVATLSPLKKLAAKVVYGGVPKGASLEEAVRQFQIAIRINPGHVNHHLELGITYLDMDRYEDAIAEFETALALPDSDPNDPEYKEEARRMIEKARREQERGRRDKSR